MWHKCEWKENLGNLRYHLLHTHIHWIFMKITYDLCGCFFKPHEQVKIVWGRSNDSEPRDHTEWHWLSDFTMSWCWSWVLLKLDLSGDLKLRVPAKIFFFFFFVFTSAKSYKLGNQLGEDKGTPLQYSCLENPMDRGTW